MVVAASLTDPGHRWTMRPRLPEQKTPGSTTIHPFFALHVFSTPSAIMSFCFSTHCCTMSPVFAVLSAFCVLGLLRVTFCTFLSLYIFENPSAFVWLIFCPHLCARPRPEACHSKYVSLHRYPVSKLMFAEVKMMTQRFSKLLLGEDMSGGGKGVCTALAISNAFTHLSATVFGTSGAGEEINVANGWNGYYPLVITLLNSSQLSRIFQMVVAYRSLKFCTQNYHKKAPAGFVRKASFNTSSVSNCQDDQ